MQSGQQFKLDQPGLIKAGPVALVVAAVSGALFIIFALWSVASLLGWIVPIFAGVWYVMTVRKGGSLPEQMDTLVNGAVLGAVAGIAFGIVALITAPIGLNSVTGGFGGLFVSAFGFGNLITQVIFGAIGGAAGAFGYWYLVKQGTIK